MQNQPNLQQRLHQLSQEKEALRAVENELQPFQLPYLSPHPTPSNRRDTLARNPFTSIKPLPLPPSVPNAIHRERRAEINLAPSSSNTISPQHAAGARKPASSARSSLSSRKSSSVKRYAPAKPSNKSSTAANASKAPPPIPDLVGHVGFQPTLSSYVLDDSPSSHQADDTVKTQSHVEGAPLQYQLTLSYHEATAARPVTAMRFHSKFDHVLLTAHAARTDGRAGAPDGTVAVWALDAPASTAFQRALVAPAPVTALEHIPISPTLVLAGTAVGSVLMWDLRVKTALPVSAFDPALSDLADCHARSAVTALRTTATSSPFFVSTSAMGHVCKWSLSQPDRPLTQSIVHDSAVSSKLPISDIDFPRSTRLSVDERRVANRAPSFFAGTLHGTVCRLEAEGRTWSVAEERGHHDAAVSAIRTHPAGMRVPHLDDVIATSSHDWSVAVWHFKRGSACNKLWSYDNVSNGLVYDIAWSMLHPTVLCGGDEAGVLSLFDVSGHLQNPKSMSSVWRFALPDDTGRTSITSVQWSNNDRFVCAGDRHGNVCVWSTTSTLASLPDAEWMGQFLKSTISH